MSEPLRLRTPLNDADVERLKVGDRVLINGIIYTGRDAAHKRLFDLLKGGKSLPFDIKGQIIYMLVLPLLSQGRFLDPQVPQPVIVWMPTLLP